MKKGHQPAYKSSNRILFQFQIQRNELMNYIKIEFKKLNEMLEADTTYKQQILELLKQQFAAARTQSRSMAE